MRLMAGFGGKDSTSSQSGRKVQGYRIYACRPWICWCPRLFPTRTDQLANIKNGQEVAGTKYTLVEFF